MTIFKIVERGYEGYMIQFKDVNMSYGDNQVLFDLNLDIEEGKLVVLIGPSGCGKTTTLQLINRLLNPTSGQVLIDGVDIQTMNPVVLRRTIGYVIQEIGLFPHMTIQQNIEIVPKLLKWPEEKRKERTNELLNLVGLDPEMYAGRYPASLSGGQQQRIGLLRALAAQPPVILMDEPFGALDPITRDTLQDEIKSLQKKLKKTIVFVTHDMSEAIKIADVIVLMKDGIVLQAASPETLLSEPANEFVEQFIGRHNTYNGRVDTVADVMKQKVFWVSSDMGFAQTIAMMEHKQVSSIIVVDENKRLLGSVGIEDLIGRQSKPGKTVADMPLCDVTTISPEAPAKEAFDLLIKNKLDVLVVVDEERHILGVVTKTSMVKSLAKLVWKEEKKHDG